MRLVDALFLDRMDLDNYRRRADLATDLGDEVKAVDDASGDCLLRSIIGPGGVRRIEVYKADPRILIAEEIVERIRRGEAAPEVTLRGGVLTIDAANRRVVYRLVRHMPEWRAWVAEWPD